MSIEVLTRCTECDVDEVWIAVDPKPGQREWRPTKGDSSFTCEHWREHQEASMRAAENPSGRAHAGTVSAKRTLLV